MTVCPKAVSSQELETAATAVGALGLRGDACVTPGRGTRVKAGTSTILQSWPVYPERLSPLYCPVP
jgi:hypothetical protein